MNDCISLNEGNLCKEATCYIESWFTKLVIAQSLLHYSLPDYQQLKVENGFNKSECSTSGKKSVVPEKFCCGTHEHNTKRLLRSFTQKCCVNSNTGEFKTYDPLFKDCCDDGDTKILC